MEGKENKKALVKRWQALKRRQDQLHKAALSREKAALLEPISGKIPPKTREGLEKAFAKGFRLVFDKGGSILEKTYSKEKLQVTYQANQAAYQAVGGRHALRAFDSAAGKSQTLDMLLTTAEGLGLGALGVGLPDIALFTGILLRGMYETALHYGFSYDSPEDRLFILMMMETAMLSGPEWEARDRVVETLLHRPDAIPATKAALDEQLQRTAAAFAADLLILKFVQGLPVLGMLGGLGNPVYYKRVMDYARLKYQRRHLLLAIRREKSRTPEKLPEE